MVVIATMLMLPWLFPLTSSAQGVSPAPTFVIANAQFWDYYQHRGGVHTLGQPISQQFTLAGKPSQLFQRALLQLDPQGNVQLFNLLDDAFGGVQQAGGLSLPLLDKSVTSAAPAAGSADYAAQMLAFLRQQVPDTFDGQPVSFLQTYLNTVPAAAAGGSGSSDSQLLLGLEIWGVPTSRPAYDPTNHDFIYQRFQRGIMHYQGGKKTTEGLLVGDWFRELLTGQGLPADLAGQVAASPYARQYDLASNHGPLRPADMPGAALDGAFGAGLSGNPKFGVVMIGPGTDDPNYVAAALNTLHAGSWYSFSGAAGPHPIELVRPGANLGALPALVQAHPGSAWLIGNEPNVPGQDDIAAPAYADFLHQVTGIIKGADPSAQLVGPNVLNWDSTCTGCAGLRASGHAWADDFVTSYQQRYGKLPLDAWGIHTYTLDWQHLPMINAATNQADLRAARAWLDGRLPGTPLWLTEFGIIWAFEGQQTTTSGGKTVVTPQGAYRSDLVAAYLDQMFGWLGAPGSGVQRWILYATSPPAEPFASRSGGIGLLDPGSLNLTPFGQQYRSWADRVGAS